VLSSKVKRMKQGFRCNHDGFTIIELAVAMVVMGIVLVSVLTFMNSSFAQYLSLQREGMVLGDLTTQSQRVTRVVRGLTDITQASANELTFYAYFSPTDDVVSLVRYYRSSDGSVLYADVTPLTANPPYGSLVTSSKKTYTLMNNLAFDSNTKTFTYLNSSSAELIGGTLDLKNIKGVKVTLTSKPGVSAADNPSQTIVSLTALRNRKTNL
jgi:prepilin-type N-terminal cleavage/methylation domain-containing protein